MNKDYIPSQRYTDQELQRLKVPYLFRDDCGDQMADYFSCKLNHSSLMDNELVYAVPLVRNFTKCHRMK